MKLSRRLIPAFAMLLVSAVLMSTASFAWFSMNTQVTATNISLTAKAPSSLTISTTSATQDFGSTVTLTNVNTINPEGVSPVTPYAKDGALLYANRTQSFYKLTAEGAASVNENGALTGAASNAAVAPGTYYADATNTDVFYDTLWIKYDGAAGAQVQLQVAATWTNVPADAIKGAFHILFTDETGALLLDLDMTVMENNATDATNTFVDLGDLELTSGAAKQINVYFYLYGTDEHCKNTNIKAAVTAGVTLTFSGVTVTPQPSDPAGGN